MIALFLLSLAADPHVVIETSLGDIDLVIYTEKAPLTATNFLKYVKAGAYTQGRIHRTVRMDNQPNNAVKIEVIQGGPAIGIVEQNSIPLERTYTTGLKHKDGVISMARDSADTATADFFICIGDQPSLDFGGRRNPDGQGFAAFGQVTNGMDIVRMIQAAPANQQRLTPPVAIHRIRLP